MNFRANPHKYMGVYDSGYPVDPHYSQGGTPYIQDMLQLADLELPDREYYDNELLWTLAGTRIPVVNESPRDHLQAAETAMKYYELPNSDHVRYGAMLATLCRNYAYLCHKKGISLVDSFDMLKKTELLSSDRALSLLTEIAGVNAVLDLAKENQTGNYLIQYVGVSVYDDMGNKAAEDLGYDIHYILIQRGIKHLIYIDMKSQRNDGNNGINLTGNSEFVLVDPRNPTSAINHLLLTIQAPGNQAASVDYLLTARDLVSAALQELHGKLLTNHQNPPLNASRECTLAKDIWHRINQT
ncbi:hypothetical protein KC685_00905 [Candidatus Dojkabacteria bacterium]|uniref:Uncharacterized protein n=1 Tax=Candidatus Dojkabacteria bacterium TaxID=2099670 RepID=A0A955I194_9BACT|nr:hypothetical protein [Candidatus Dojkabacteria bacterium]